MIAVFVAIITVQLAADGPVGKFNDNPPDIDRISKVAIYDIERCLINTTDPLGAPFVYAQPDRPSEVLLLWGGQGNTVRRIDLKAVAGGTHIVGWHIGKRAAACAEKQ